MKPETVVARNYATAFLNSYIDEISVDDFSAVRQVLTFWESNRGITSLLDMPGLSVDEKMDGVKQLLKKLSAPPSLGELIFLLIRHKRVFLIKDVLAQVCSLYKRKKDILFFTISSAHQLLDDELSSIKQFLERKTGKTILYECAIDKDLIAGIRCQSETLVWEHSVRKQLDDLRKQLILQGAT
ncbi:ATP synthase F1 subunit delta [Candidatus Dependentiae bacterium]